MNDENQWRGLLYLLGAVVLALLGIFLLLGIFSVTIQIVKALIPFALIALAIYLAYRWWVNRR